MAAERAAKADPFAVLPGSYNPADLLLRDARQLLEIDDVLTAETWASGWLGEAWSTAAVTEHEPEHQLCMQVTGRACSTPSPHSLAAIDALARVAPAGDISMLADTLDILAETQPLPALTAERSAQARSFKGRVSASTSASRGCGAVAAAVRCTAG